MSERADAQIQSEIADPGSPIEASQAAEDQPKVPTDGSKDEDENLGPVDPEQAI